MITNTFTAAMTEEELIIGEARHQEGEKSKRLVMAAGLTNSNEELSLALEKDEELYMTLLRGAVTAYEENKSLNELLVCTLSRLVSVVNDENNEVVNRAMEIIRANATGKAS